jgi:Domain of unknown function (DUF4440)
MKPTDLFLVLMVMLSAASPLPAQLNPVPGGQRQADRDSIRSHIDKIFQAYIARDRETIQATHSSDWRGYISPSRQIVRGIDQYMQAADNVQKLSRMTGYKILDFDAVFYDDVAVVPYIADVNLDLGGAQINSKLRVLDVYAKLAGDWIQIASNTAVHPEAQAAYEQQLFPLSPGLKQGLLTAREAVWRAYFNNERPRLEQLVPAETIAINAGEEAWQNQGQVLAGAEQFSKSGARLTRLEFPKTEVQMYGPVAVLYSMYLFEIASNGRHETHSGRATEIFVNREGKWVNVGWHLDSGS